MAARLKQDFPQLPLLISGDSLYACGPVITCCQRNHGSYVLTFKPGRTPALWADFQGLLPLCPDPRANCVLPDATRQAFRWINDQPLSPHNVRALATQAGRVRSKIENQGFNTQKNSGLNLEHAYSTDPEVMKAFYYLLQIAHLFLQMFERGSLLRHLAKQYHCAGPIQLIGSLKNLAQWLLDSLRYFHLDAQTFEPWSGQIRLFDSS